MDYSIRQLSDLAGVSTRTLRYYDEIGLLKPLGKKEGGYRYYGPREVELLQQILFYRERGLELGKIKAILESPDFQVLTALEEHLIELKRQEAHLSDLIHTVNQTIFMMKGEIQMDDKQKFEAFKKGLVEEKEKKYGQEAREKYGDISVEESNQKFLKLSREEYGQMENLGEEILQVLEKAVSAGEKPQGEAGKKVADLHRQWLGFTWKTYSVEAHQGLAQMYVADKRFKAYYDRKVEGCAEFLKNAILTWCQE